MGHWRMLEPGTTREKAYSRLKRERKAHPNHKYRVRSYKSPLTYGSKTKVTIYVPEVWYP